jgi:hypothetical protein
MDAFSQSDEPVYDVVMAHIGNLPALPLTGGDTWTEAGGSRLTPAPAVRDTSAVFCKVESLPQGISR